MFGVYRVVLAAAVVVHHAKLFKVGGFAVFSFFVLSGFLMTLLICDTYKGRRGAFALNRFLRLYPQYWFTMALMAGLVLYGLPLPRPDVGVPPLNELLPDLAYINYWHDSPQLLLTAWAVSNEIVFYILIGLGLSATRTRTLLWFGASVVVYVLIQMLAPRSSDLFYFSPVAASLPFALGAMMFHYRHLFSGIQPLGLAVIAAGTMIGIMLFDAGGSTRPVTQLPYLLGSAALTLALYFLGERHAAGAQTAGIWRRWDDAAGMLSYPMYLNHFGAMMLVIPWVTLDLSHGQYTLIVVFTSMVLAAIAVLLVDRPVNKVRDRLRRSGR